MKEYKVKTFLITLVSAVCVGVVWELIENYTQITFTRASGYGFNTAMDILNDGLGGVIAYFYFVQNKKCCYDVCDVMHPFYNQTGLIKN